LPKMTVLPASSAVVAPTTVIFSKKVRLTIPFQNPFWSSSPVVSRHSRLGLAYHCTAISICISRR
jgi:hypothetical protein